MEHNNDIEEAQIVEEKTSDAKDLLSELSKASANKTPKAASSNGWKFNDEEEEEDIDFTGADTEDEEEKPNQEKKTEPKKTGKVTSEAKAASARTAVGMINLLQRGIFTPILNYKYKKKFTDEEIEKLDHIADADKKKLTSEELSIRNKFDRLMDARDKKAAGIPFSDREQKDMEEAFRAYFDFKEKTLPPEWFVAMAVIKSIGDRAIDIFME